MRIAASKEEIAAALAYQELHVPALFRQWTPQMVKAVKIQPGQRVLDVACGTGVLASEAARQSGEGFVVGLDPNPGMLAVAQQLDPAIEWRVGKAESLPFEDESFDAVLCQFGLMFFPDRAAALREMLRVLVPGGRLAIAVWESLENSEAYPTVVALLERLAGKPAGNALRAPFVLGDRVQLANFFQVAGVASVEIVTLPGRAQFPSIRTMVEADLRGWLPIMGVTLNEDQIQSILQEAESALHHHLTPQGTVEFSAPAHIVTGRKPASNASCLRLPGGRKDHARKGTGADSANSGNRPTSRGSEGAFPVAVGSDVVPPGFRLWTRRMCESRLRPANPDP